MEKSRAILATNRDNGPEIHDDAYKVPTYDAQAGPPGLGNKSSDAVTQKGNQENPFVREAAKYQDMYKIPTYNALVGPPGLKNKSSDTVTQKSNQENPFGRKSEKCEDVYEVPTYTNPHAAPDQRNECEGITPGSEAHYWDDVYDQHYYEATVRRNVTDGNTPGIPELPGPNSSEKTPFIIALVFLGTVCIIQMVVLLTYKNPYLS